MHLYILISNFKNFTKVRSTLYFLFSEASAGLLIQLYLVQTFRCPEWYSDCVHTVCVCVCISLHTHTTTHKSDSVCAHAIILVLNMYVLKSNILRNKVQALYFTVCCFSCNIVSPARNSRQCCELKHFFFVSHGAKVHPRSIAGTLWRCNAV